MDQLKNGIGLRSLGQQDPAAAYAHEGFEMFDEMISGIKEDMVKFCYNVTIQTNTERKTVIGKGSERKAEFDARQYAEGSPESADVPEREFKQQTVIRSQPKIGRNEPCPCGSGKKYKNCCGRNEQ